MLDTATTILEGRTVLLLGADAATRNREAAMLRDLGAAAVVEAATVADALASTGGASIVMADIDSGGLDLLRGLRANPATENIVVVMIANVVTGEIINASKAARANDALVRPFDLDDLAETVESAFED